MLSLNLDKVLKQVFEEVLEYFEGGEEISLPNDRCMRVVGMQYNYHRDIRVVMKIKQMALLKNQYGSKVIIGFSKKGKESLVYLNSSEIFIKNLHYNFHYNIGKVLNSFATREATDSDSFYMVIDGKLETPIFNMLSSSSKICCLRKQIDSEIANYNGDKKKLIKTLTEAVIIFVQEQF